MEPIRIHYLKKERSIEPYKTYATLLDHNNYP